MAPCRLAIWRTCGAEFPIRSAPASRPPHPDPLPGERGRRRRAIGTRAIQRGVLHMHGHVRTTGVARRLRRNATVVEQRLWYRLRSRSLYGMKFVRPEPIGPCIVDFVCRERSLIIEVDGGQHAESERDVVRDRWLRVHGYCVLRFWNND